jgi:hypothetical protein
LPTSFPIRGQDRGIFPDVRTSIGRGRPREIVQDVFEDLDELDARLGDGGLEAIPHVVDHLLASGRDLAGPKATAMSPLLVSVAVIGPARHRSGVSSA